MAASVRGAFTRAIPWLALVVVAVFAFVQLRAHHDVRGRLVKLEDDRRAEASRDPGSALQAAERARATGEREARLDEALGAERLALAEARASVAAREEALRTARDDAERLEALRSVDAARAAALARRVTDLEEQVAGLRAEREAARARTASPASDDPVRRWLADAASGDAERLRYARACAAGATPEQVTRLRALAGDDASLQDAAARLAGALPDSDATRDLVVALLVGPPEGDRSARWEALQDEVVREPAGPLLAALLRAGGGTWGETLLRQVAPWLEGAPPADRGAVRDALLFLLAAAEPAARRLGALGLGLARLEGGAVALGGLLGDPAAHVRAAAAHALSRVPDAGEAQAAARGALPALLADEARAVRTAGLLLAERVLGAPLDFDPGAPPAERAAALARLAPRLGP